MNELEPITLMLGRWMNGDSHAIDYIISGTYEKLYLIARAQMARESPNHTFTPTALLNEAFLKLAQVNRFSFENRRHFYATIALLMRRVLVDYANAAKMAKRNGHKVPLEYAGALEARCEIMDIISLDQALNRLGKLDRRQRQVVELRFFCGFSMKEISHILGISLRMVELEWTMAKAWLKCQVGRESVGA